MIFKLILLYFVIGMAAAVTYMAFVYIYLRKVNAPLFRQLVAISVRMLPGTSDFEKFLIIFLGYTIGWPYIFIKNLKRNK